jgi:hypothetical protein
MWTPWATASWVATMPTDPPFPVLEFPAATPAPLRAFAGAHREQPYYRDSYAYNGGRDPSTRMVRPTGVGDVIDRP